MTTTTLTPAIGRSTLGFVDRFHPDRPIEVNVYRPAGHTPEGPVVVVLHEMQRNGDEYRDFWIPAAEKHGILIVAPTFSDAHFPKHDSYNNGLVVGPDGAIAPRDTWLYGVPARVLEALRAGGVTTRAQARLFGHSAGGQFVHRLLATQDHAPFETAMAANPGWYTLPTLERPFPEGLAGLGLDEAALARWLAWPMIVFAGDQDNLTDEQNLPKHPAALAQGPMRYARAQFMVDFGRREAARLGLAFNWRLITVTDVGHDGGAMSRAAAAWWFEGRVPDVAELGVQSAAVL
jgi:dienelactone hydrolase